MSRTTIQDAAASKAIAQHTGDNKPRGPGAQMDRILKSQAMQEHFNSTLKDKTPSFMASIIDLYASDKALQNCNASHVALECLKAATLDLPINKQLGFAYIVPYGNTPTFILGYKGYIQLAQRTGAYRYINSDKVLEGELRSRDKLTGNVDLSGEAVSDKVVGYFAYIETLNGFSKTLYMSVDEITAHAKRYSKSFNNPKGAWATNFDDMAMKTCLRQLISKWGIMSVEMVRAIELEDSVDLADMRIVEEDNLVGDYDVVSEQEVDTETGEVIEALPGTDDEDTPDVLAFAEVVDEVPENV